MVFIGDSTTYGLKAYEVLDASQVWTPSSGTLALFNQSIATIVYPPTGEEIPITDAVGRAKPDYVVLTIGVNGVSMMDEQQFKEQYTALIERIKSVSPGTRIICNSIYPVEAMYEAKDNGINNAVIDRAAGYSRLPKRPARTLQTRPPFSRARTESSFPITATATAYILTPSALSA